MSELDAIHQHEIRQEARRNTRGRFEQWAKNPTCDANTLSAVHNVRLDMAAKAIGLEVSFGQSPFAIARGNRFEAGLFWDDAQKLRAALERRGCLPGTSVGFLDLRLKMNGGARIRSVDHALQETEAWLRRIAAEPTTAESIVAAPMIKIPKGVILPEALLIIDAVTVTTTDDGCARVRAGQGHGGPGVDEGPDAGLLLAGDGHELLGAGFDGVTIKAAEQSVDEGDPVSGRQCGQRFADPATDVVSQRRCLLALGDVLGDCAQAHQPGEEVPGQEALVDAGRELLIPHGRQLVTGGDGVWSFQDLPSAPAASSPLGRDEARACHQAGCRVRHSSCLRRRSANAFAMA